LGPILGLLFLGMVLVSPSFWENGSPPKTMCAPVHDST
jgi:hypothetical protein